MSPWQGRFPRRGPSLAAPSSAASCGSPTEVPTRVSAAPRRPRKSNFPGSRAARRESAPREACGARPFCLKGLCGRCHREATVTRDTPAPPRAQRTDRQPRLPGPDAPLRGAPRRGPAAGASRPLGPLPAARPPHGASGSAAPSAPADGSASRLPSPSRPPRARARATPSDRAAASPLYIPC